MQNKHNHKKFKNQNIVSHEFLHSKGVVCLEISENRQLMITGGMDWDISVWSLSKAAVIQHLADEDKLKEQKTLD